MFEEKTNISNPIISLDKNTSQLEQNLDKNNAIEIVNKLNIVRRCNLEKNI